MKKILLILTCISLTLLSCDSDDDSSPTASSLVGSWVTEWDIYNPEEQIIGKMEVEYTFTSKGEITLRNVWPDLDTYIETVTTGTYKDFGDYLAIDYKKAVETCTEPDGSVNYKTVTTYADGKKTVVIYWYGKDGSYDEFVEEVELQDRMHTARFKYSMPSPNFLDMYALKSDNTIVEGVAYNLRRK